MYLPTLRKSASSDRVSERGNIYVSGRGSVYVGEPGQHSRLGLGTSSNSSTSPAIGFSSVGKAHSKLSVFNWFISKFGQQLQQQQQQEKEEEESSSSHKGESVPSTSIENDNNSTSETTTGLDFEDQPNNAGPQVIVPSDLSFVITAIESRHVLKVQELRELMQGAKPCFEQVDEFEPAKILFLLECCLAQNR
jgi:hypothetical protein